MTKTKTPAELFLFASDDHIGTIRDYANAARAILDSPNDHDRDWSSALGRVLDDTLLSIGMLEDDHRNAFHETFGNGSTPIA